MVELSAAAGLGPQPLQLREPPAQPQGAAAGHTSSAGQGRSYIACLLGPRPQDVANALVMIRSLRSFEDNNRTSVLILYEGIPTRHTEMSTLDLLRQAASAAGRELKAVQVTFPPDPTYPLPRFRAGTALGSRRGWAYFHMCLFFFRDIFFLQELSDAQYIMRFDTDSCLLGRLPDVFRALDSQPLVDYVANGENWDCYGLVTGLRALAERFASERNLTMKERVWSRGRDASCLRGFYNNFEARFTPARHRRASPPRVTAARHRHVPPPRATATCHHRVPGHQARCVPTLASLPPVVSRRRCRRWHLPLQVGRRDPSPPLSQPARPALA